MKHKTIIAVILAMLMALSSVSVLAAAPPAPKSAKIRVANVSLNRNRKQCVYIVASWSSVKKAKKYKVSYSGDNIKSGSFYTLGASCANNIPLLKKAGKGGKIKITVKAINSKGQTGKGKSASKSFKGVKNPK